MRRGHPVESANGVDRRQLARHDGHLVPESKNNDDWRAQFWTGLTTPSASALASAAATVLVLGGFAAFKTGPGWFADGGTRWLAADPEDDAAFIIARLQDLDSFPPGGVVLLGGSGLREAITSPQSLAEELSKRAGRPVGVTDLSMNGETLIESAYLAAEVDQPSLLLVALSPPRFQYTAEHQYQRLHPPRTGLFNEVLVDEMSRLGWAPPLQTGFPLIDMPGIYGARLPQVPANLIRGGTEQRTHHYLGQHPPPPESISLDWDQRITDFQAEKDRHRATLARMAEWSEEHGHSVVLFEGPLRKDVFGDDGEQEFYGLYEALAGDLPAELDLPRVTVEGAGLLPTDYADPVHLNNKEAMARVTSLLAERLLPHLPEP